MWAMLCCVHVQALRAAKFVWSAVRFRAALLDEKLEPEVFHLNPEKTKTPRYTKAMRYRPNSNYYDVTVTVCY